MSPITLSVILFAAAAAAAAPLVSASGGASPNGLANDLLPKYGLPKGLIPDAIASYTFNETTGEFVIHLASTCYVWFGSHHVYYDETISGTISYGTITSLTGIQAQKFFVWVYLDTIVAHPEKGTLKFSAGFISEELEASMFQDIPVCGAGAQLRGAAGVIRELGVLPVAEV